MYFSPIHPVQGGAAAATNCVISAAMVAEPIFDLTVVLNACIAQTVSAKLSQWSVASSTNVHTQLAKYIVGCLQL